MKRQLELQIQVHPSLQAEECTAQGVCPLVRDRNKQQELQIFLHQCSKHEISWSFDTAEHVFLHATNAITVLPIV